MPNDQLLNNDNRSCHSVPYFLPKTEGAELSYMILSNLHDRKYSVSTTHSVNVQGKFNRFSRKFQ